MKNGKPASSGLGYWVAGAATLPESYDNEQQPNEGHIFHLANIKLADTRRNGGAERAYGPRGSLFLEPAGETGQRQ